MGAATSVATNGIVNVVAERAVRYHQCCMADKVCIIVNGIGTRVAAHGTVVYFQRCETATVSVIEDTSAVISVAVGDGESGNRYGATWTDVKYATVGIAVDSQVLRSWP